MDDWINFKEIILNSRTYEDYVLLKDESTYLVTIKDNPITKDIAVPNENVMYDLMKSCEALAKNT